MLKALVVLSGGQDSTTCLYKALAGTYDEVEAVTFDYGQRHAIEVESAAQIAEIADVKLEVLRLPNGILSSTSPLVDYTKDVQHYVSAEGLPGGIEKTFVPLRNLLFLTLAANRAVAQGCRDIFIGVSQEDFGGYPDCRDSFIRATEMCINRSLPIEAPLRIVTPLIFLSKKQTVQLAMELEGCMEALAYSHTCYDGEYPPNPHNHASLLRAKGFHDAAVGDPLILRAIDEGLLPDGYPTDGYLPEGSAAE